MRDIKEKEYKETVLGAETAFKGRLSFHMALVVKGSYEGEIEADGDLSIEPSAVVSAHVEAGNLRVSGSLQGNASVRGKAEIGETGSLIGDLQTSSLKLSQGGVLRGRVSMLKDPEAIDIFSASPAQLKKLAMER